MFGKIIFLEIKNFYFLKHYFFFIKNFFYFYFHIYLNQIYKKIFKKKRNGKLLMIFS
jgi:hypothetical protein